jgi:hypothetical protein
MALLISSSLDIVGGVSASVYRGDGQYLTNITTASYALNSEKLNNRGSEEFINTGSSNGNQDITGSLTITQNLTVLGSASIAYITASQTLVDQNTITVFGSGSGLPTAGFIAADTSSAYESSSFLYNLMDEIWTLDKPLSGSLIGTASFATSASIASTSSLALTASVAVTASFALTSSQAVTSSFALTASVAETASYALTASYLSGSIESASYAFTASYLEPTATASYALTASYVEVASVFPYSGSADITGSLSVIGSTVASGSLTVTGSTEITGSLIVTGSIISTDGFTGSLFGTASIALSASFISSSDLQSDVILTGVTGGWDQTINTDLLLRGKLSQNYLNQNVVLGGGAGESLVDGFNDVNNTLIGHRAGANLKGQGNTIIGSGNFTKTNGNYNVAIGFGQGQDIETGSENIMIGSWTATNSVKTLINTVTIGHYIQNVSGSTGNILIGNRISADGFNNTAIIGNSDIVLTKLHGTISGSLFTGSFDGIFSGSLTGSLEGTASYASSSLSSSYAATASILLGSVESASYAFTASYLEPGATASYALTASLLLGTIASASYALTASYIDADNISSSVIVPGETSSGNLFARQTINTDLLLSGKLNAIYGRDNIIIGKDAGYNVTQSVTTGTPSFAHKENIFIGIEAGYNSISGSGNIALGTRTLRLPANARNNIVIGYDALSSDTTQNLNGNIAIGENAMKNTISGSFMVENNSIAIGKSALFNATRPVEIIAIGTAAGAQDVNGNPLTQNDKSIYIGWNTKPLSGSNGIFEMVIGADAKGRGALTTTIGSPGTTTHTYLEGMVTASLFSGSFIGNLDGTATTASYFEKAITTGSLNAEQGITGSLTITQNLTVLGSSSFVYVTASQVLVDQNTLTVFANGLALPTAGYLVADTSSVYSGSSFLYNVVDEIWTLDKPLSASLQGSSYGYTHIQTASSTVWTINHDLNNLYPGVTVWSGSFVIQPDEIERINSNTLQISFTVSQSGAARIV